MVMDNLEEDANSVSAVSSDDGCAPLEEVLADLLKDTSLSTHQQDLFLTLLLDYTDVFARSKSELGRADLLQHEIVTA